MAESKIKSDGDVVTWRELRAAIADILKFSTELTAYATMMTSSEEERKKAEVALKEQANELEVRYRLEEFSPDE